MIIRKPQSESGFTLIELLFVIIVICILSGIIITTYAGIQQKERDTTRESDINALQSQLTGFFSQNGYYPNAHDLNSYSFITKNLKGFAIKDEADPSSHCTLPSATQPTGDCISTSIKKKFYAYVVSPSTCEGAGNDSTCTGYTLTATLETSPASTYSKANLD